ncbi:MAG: hypothetical protein PUP92_05625 [Rhizonema sp. PD38]|nr:hypothetical protein [Rhizonema sp. PD38]
MIATDNNKAIKFLQKNFPHLQILSSPEIIKHWSEKQSIDSLVLSNVLDAIRIKGRYVPQKNAPLQNWWQKSSDISEKCRGSVC